MRTLLAAALFTFGLGCVPAFAGDCNDTERAAPGGVLGSALGGLLPYGKSAAGDALLESLANHAIARDMDCEDQPYAARAYVRSFRGSVGRRNEWSHGRNRGYVVSSREYFRDQRLCRDFTQVVYRRGREFNSMGTACRKDNDIWEFL